MNRRVLYLSVLLAIFALINFGSQGSNANQAGSTGRFKTVEIEVRQYIWDLVLNRDGSVICQVMVEHPNRPSNQEAITICGAEIFPPEPIPTPFFTPTPGGEAVPTAVPEEDSAPFDLAEFFRNVSWRFVTTQEFVRTVEVPVPDMVVNLVVPENQTTEYYASIYAYEPLFGEHITEIRGYRNGREFFCPTARCDVPISTDSSIEFWAVSSYGDESQHSQATFRVVTTDQGSKIELSSLVPLIVFQDSCAVIWGLPRYEMPEWSDFPPLPDYMNTMKPYQYLAGKLISAGVVSAPDCPGGGLLASGAPNTCGLERASTSVIEWQNQFDLVIWNTGRKTGVPPLLIKTLIEQESQFWPGNARRELFEYGLGQMNQSGADVALRWDNDLFNQICNGLIYDCRTIYGRLPSWVQATIRGGLMRAMNSECPSCTYGIDLYRAQESIPMIAQTLRSNCRQVKFMTDRRRMKLSYEDMWKLSFVSYHSGYQCLAEALDRNIFNKYPATWENISRFLTCAGGTTYVNDVWKSLTEFDASRIKRPESPRPVYVPTFVATPEPTRVLPPTATPFAASLGSIRVLVYVDSNANNYPEANERVNDAAVEVRFPDGQIISGKTVNGEVLIDLTGHSVGVDVIVALPELYRTQRVRIPQDGEIPVVFRLDAPVVPPTLP
jgi:hypothetical protein